MLRYSTVSKTQADIFLLFYTQAQEYNMAQSANF